jgi:site-specific recombinase XerD
MTVRAQNPSPLADFLDMLRPVKKPSTCSGAAVHLRDFHRWLADQGIALSVLDRPAMERWLKALADRSLTPHTRCKRIFQTRCYLEWLAERAELCTHPDDLIRRGDFPKIPSLLPRPFPPEADREIQRRLAVADGALEKALLLMRRSGIRIGELVGLEPTCVILDRDDNALLKVPLGKLNNERLVPIDQPTHQIVRAFKHQCPPDAPYLIDPGRSRAVLITRLRVVLRQVAEGLEITGRVVTHRLRHTYATELLNAGMGLVTIMKLLGHHSFRMTMGYAALTQHTVSKDYHTAMAKIGALYDLPSSPPPLQQSDPEQMLTNTVAWIRNNAEDLPRAQHLIKRLYKIRTDIAALSRRPARL